MPPTRHPAIDAKTKLGHVALRPSPAGARRPGFTLMELLVVIGICCVLLAILLPAMRSVRDEANTITCAAHLRQIGAAMLSYTRQYDDRLFQQRDYGKWTDASNKSKMIDPYDEDAYWGVPYAKFGAPKQLYFCPSAHDVSSGSNSDGSFYAGFVYVCYSINGYGGKWSGFSAATRKTVFGSTAAQCALFVKDPASAEWFGRPMTSVAHPDQLIVIQDAYEYVLDGNGDTFNDWYQWTPPNHSPDESFEWLRHHNSANVLFADWHVDRLTRQDQSDARWYTGQW